MAFKASLELLVVLSCASIVGVWADCSTSGARTVEERTRNVPVVVKGIVVARGHTGNRFTVRVGRILKGGNESIAGTQINVKILKNPETSSVVSETLRTEQSSETSRTLRTEQTSGSAIPTTQNTQDGYVRDEVTPVTSDTELQTSQNSLATTGQPSTDSTQQVTTAVRQATQVTCVDEVALLGRYILFLRPIEGSRVFFEEAESAVPHTRQNLRRVRQAVKDEQDALGFFVNTTLPEDDHIGPCTDSYTEQNYCLNGGSCAVWRNLNKHFCMCTYPYHGERCAVVDPALTNKKNPVDLNETTLAIAVILAFMLVITVICAIAYVIHKNSVWRERAREIEKRVQYLQERYPSIPSRRNSPGGASLNIKQNSVNEAGEGAPHIIVFQDMDGKHSRQGSLNSNQYRLLAELRTDSRRGSGDITPPQGPRRDSRTSAV